MAASSVIDPSWGCLRRSRNALSAQASGKDPAAVEIFAHDAWSRVMTRNRRPGALPFAKLSRSLDATRRPSPIRTTWMSPGPAVCNSFDGEIPDASAIRYNVAIEGVDRPRSTSLADGL